MALKQQKDLYHLKITENINIFSVIAHIHQGF
jgi:hypothetical protein